MSRVWLQIQDLAQVRLCIRIAAQSGEVCCHGQSYSSVEWVSLNGAFDLLAGLRPTAQCHEVESCQVCEGPRRNAVAGRRQGEPARRLFPVVIIFRGDRTQNS